MSKARLLVGSSVGFVCGFIAASGAGIAVWRSETIQTKYHWSRLNTWLEIVDNPKHKGPIENPFDVEPTLAALVSLGELQQVDLVLPRVFVTEEVHRRLHYLFQKHHRNIVYWTYDTQSRFGTSGRQPLHMQIWYLPAETESVRDVVETLEKRFAAKEDGEGEN